MSSLGYLLVTSKEANLFVDGRYITEAQTMAKNVKVNELFASTFYQHLQTICQDQEVKTIGIEANFVTVKQLET